MGRCVVVVVVVVVVAAAAAVALLEKTLAPDEKLRPTLQLE